MGGDGDRGHRFRFKFKFKHEEAALHGMEGGLRIGNLSYHIHV